MKHNIHPDLLPLMMPIDECHLDPANARTGHDVDQIAGSLRQYGQRKPIIVNRSEGNKIEAGNGTWKAAKAEGWTHIAAVVVEDSPMTAAGYAIADNRLAELSRWDLETLKTLVDSIDPNLGLITGFEDGDLEEMLRAAAGRSFRVGRCGGWGKERTREAGGRRLIEGVAEDVISDLSAALLPFAVFVAVPAAVGAPARPLAVVAAAPLGSHFAAEGLGDLHPLVGLLDPLPPRLREALEFVIVHLCFVLQKVYIDVVNLMDMLLGRGTKSTVSSMSFRCLLERVWAERKRPVAGPLGGGEGLRGLLFFGVFQKVVGLFEQAADVAHGADEAPVGAAAVVEIFLQLLDVGCQALEKVERGFLVVGESGAGHGAVAFGSVNHRESPYLLAKAARMAARLVSIRVSARRAAVLLSMPARVRRLYSLIQGAQVWYLLICCLLISCLRFAKLCDMLLGRGMKSTVNPMSFQCLFQSEWGKVVSK